MLILSKDWDSESRVEIQMFVFNIFAENFSKLYFIFADWDENRKFSQFCEIFVKYFASFLTECLRYYSYSTVFVCTLPFRVFLTKKQIQTIYLQIFQSWVRDNFSALQHRNNNATTHTDHVRWGRPDSEEVIKQA